MTAKDIQDLQQRIQQLELENRLLHESLNQADRLDKKYTDSLRAIKKAKEALQERDTLIRGMLDSAMDCVISMDEEGLIVEFNHAAEKVFGYAREDVLGRELAEVIIPPALREKHRQGMKRWLAGHAYQWLNNRMETTGMRADGSEFAVELSITAVQQGDTLRFSGFIRDISRVKQIEKQLQKRVMEAEQARSSMLLMLEDLNESTANIERAKTEWEQTFDAVTDPVFSHDEYFQIIRANRAYAEHAGMSVQDVIGKPYWQVFPKCEGPLPGCLHACAKGKTEGKRAGEAEEEVRTEDGRIFLSRNYSMSDAKGKLYAVHFMEDITERTQLADRLRESLEGTIHAIASAAEVRDPYTAGHQERVAEIACAIGNEMGLENDQIEGIRMGGKIHDIGKIHLPSEILSKPTRLTEIEYTLIQSHPQVGYELLKDIDFPWPVADIAHQHHERMDGSGYPQGLKGEETCLEARIVAVADVVEAMANHRPYRPGLGIEKALAEIERGRGSIYDTDVANACLHLFREHGFTMDDTH
ncbi:MAG: PAS domain S-box protein [Mariprofundus sp.]|nr:PAS domain S-box protein [Mariprofundus sp.]